MSKIFETITLYISINRLSFSIKVAKTACLDPENIHIDIWLEKFYFPNQIVGKEAQSCYLFYGGGFIFNGIDYQLSMDACAGLAALHAYGLPHPDLAARTCVLNK